MSHVVIASALNLRSEPQVRPGNRLAVLVQGSPVDVLDDREGDWWQVQARPDGAEVMGFVAARHLAAAVAAPDPEKTVGLRVHLAALPPRARRDHAGARAFPLNEPGQPGRDGTTPAQRAAALDRIIDWLDVEHSPRYLREGSATFCNIYAYDLCYLAGAYLPRVFWHADVLPQVLAGQPVPVRYGQTVSELNANALHEWLQRFGPQLGWRRSFNFDQAQAAANAGEIAVLVAQRVERNQSGHIVVLVPERAQIQALRDPTGKVLRPVTSEAGATNRQRSVPPSQWWTAAKFREWALWLHP